MDEKKVQAKMATLMEEWRSITSGEEAMTPDDKEKLDKVKVDFAAYRAQLNELKEQRAAADELAEDQRSFRHGARRIVEPTDEERAALEPEGPKYLDAFNEWVARSFNSEPAMIEKRDFSDSVQAIGTPADGGYLAPDEWTTEILRQAGQINTMRSLATVIQTNRGSYKKFVRLTDLTAAQEDELETFSRGKITFGEFEVVVHKIAIEVPLSHEVIQDSVINMQAEVTTAIAEAFADLAGAWYVVGNGTKQAFGVAVGSVLGKTAAAIDAITMDETKELVFSVPSKYRKGSKVGFLMNDTTLLMLGLLKDGIQHYFVQEDVREGVEFNLHGRKIWADDSMVDPATGTKPLLYGDFSKYLVADRQTYIQVDPYSSGRDGVVLVRAFIRTGGKLQPVGAVNHLIMA